jgi:hypothetical protein
MQEQVRAKTLAELGRRDDQWLEEQTSFGNGQRVNNYLKWFHVIGHEINHTGQIQWLRSRWCCASGARPANAGDREGR